MWPPLTAPSACPTELGRSGQAVSEPTYTLPPLIVKQGAFKFRSQFVVPADAAAIAVAEARQLGASTKLAWRVLPTPDEWQKVVQEGLQSQVITF